jgi:predicted DNA-binding WGR domain protein
VRRFYIGEVMPTLFGEWSLLREWGRLGSPGTGRHESFGELDEAQTAEQRIVKRRLRRGYRIRSYPAAKSIPELAG